MRICAIFKYTLHLLFNFQLLNAAGEKPPLSFLPYHFTGQRAAGRELVISSPDLFFSSYLSYGEFKQPACGDKSTPTSLSRGKVAVSALNPAASSVPGISRTLEGAAVVTASAALLSMQGTVQR